MFNKLTDAQTERLYLLGEELGEVQQAIGKVLRHGYKSTHPNGGPTNVQQLQHELGDVLYIVDMLCDSGDLDSEYIHYRAECKSESIKPYLHHQSVTCKEPDANE